MPPIKGMQRMQSIPIQGTMEHPRHAQLVHIHLWVIPIGSGNLKACNEPADCTGSEDCEWKYWKYWTWT